MAQPPATPIRIAIIGGGIGAVSLAVGLLQHSHLDVHVYEGGVCFTELGAAVGLGANALKVLERLDKEGRARTAVDSAGATRHSPSVRMIMAKGPNAGHHIIDIDPSGTAQASVSRARLLSSLLSLIPSSRLHARKRLARIERSDGYSIPLSSMYAVDSGPLTIHFTDNTSIIADAVIGADRMRGTTRLQMLGVGHPASRPVYAGQVAWRCVVPLHAVKGKLPEEWWGNGFDLCLLGENGFMILDRVPDEEMISLVVVEFREEWESDTWLYRGDWEHLRRVFQDWSKDARSVIELMNTDSLQTWPLLEHPKAPTYAKGRICLIGDAAHASTPWLGAGAGQALEDALLLSTLLSSTHTSTDLPTAFRAYDTVRRPRTQKIVDLSRETGEIFRRADGGRADGDGIEVLRQKLERRWDQVWNKNLDFDRDCAMESMKTMRMGQMGRRTQTRFPHGQGNY